MKYKNITLRYKILKNLILVLIFLFLFKCTNKYNIKNVTTLNEFKKSIKSSQILKNINQNLPKKILSLFKRGITLNEIKHELNRSYKNLINDDLSLISILKTNISQEYFISEENYIEIYNELKTILKSQQFKNNINEIVDEFICDEKNKVKYKTRLNTLLGIETKNTYELKKIIIKENQTKLTIEGYCRKIFSNMKQQLPQVLLNMIMKFYPFCYDYTILDKNDIELVSFKSLKKWENKLSVFCGVEFYDINHIKVFVFCKEYKFYNSCFKGTNLFKARFLGKAYLTHADFTNSNLSRAHLPGADLSYANLTGANLTRVFLFLSYLIYASLNGAILEKSTLFQANLTGADLSQANLSRVLLTAADLTDANLNYTNLTGANLLKTNLTGADLKKANLIDTSLKDANLNYTNLTGANLLKTNLTGADLTGANLYNTNILGAKMKNTIINYFKQINKIAKSVIDNNGLDANFVLKERKILAFLSEDFLISELKKIKEYDESNFNLILKLLMEYFRNKLSYKKFNSSDVFIKEVQKFYNLENITTTLYFIQDMYQYEIDKGFIKIID